MKDLRLRSEGILKRKYPAADVDTSGGKAIKVSGGSLPRPVDVVPSHWNDTIDFQRSGVEHDRGVTIFDKKVALIIDNLPFKHIKLINDHDLVAFYGLKKAIRLAKNVRSDADREVKLPSFDIAAIMYHADVEALKRGAYHELAILAETQRHLDYLYSNPTYAKTLRVPDGSREIFDTEEKLDGLLALSCEMDDLAKEVAKEQSAQLRYLQPDSWLIRKTLQEAYVPAA